jgi:hypothetical protein
MKPVCCAVLHFPAVGAFSDGATGWPVLGVGGPGRVLHVQCPPPSVLLLSTGAETHAVLT